MIRHRTQNQNMESLFMTKDMESTSVDFFGRFSGFTVHRRLHHA